MPSVLERYRPHHQLGLDCRLTCLRNMLDYFGTKESYATVFGMSSSFNFVYRKDGFSFQEKLEMPDCDFTPRFYPISGHRLDCMEKLAYTYSATAMGNYPDDAEASFSRMKEFLSNGIPVMVALSRRALCEMLGRSFGSPPFLEGLEFGGHWVILVSIDDATETVTIFETDMPEPIAMSRDQFQRSRTEGDDDDRWFLKSRNRWFVFMPPIVMPLKEDMFHTALRKTVFHMRQCDVRRRVYTGLCGLGKLAEEMPNWHVGEDFTEDRLKATAWMMQLQGEIVSSGGLGRRLFSSYLHQAARICRSESLQVASNQCAQASKAWRDVISRTVSLILDQNRLDLKSDSDLKPLLETIVDSENRAVEAISTFVERG